MHTLLVGFVVLNLLLCGVVQIMMNLYRFLSIGYRWFKRFLKWRRKQEDKK